MGFIEVNVTTRIETSGTVTADSGTVTAMWDRRSESKWVILTTGTIFLPLY